MKIILLDLDGTALSDRKIIEPETRRILQQCHSNGILIGFVTARTKRKLYDLVEGIPFDFMASYDGALIESDAGEIIAKHEIENEYATCLIDKLKQEVQDGVFAYFEPYYYWDDIITMRGSSCQYDYRSVDNRQLGACQRVRLHYEKSKSYPPLKLHRIPDLSVYREGNDFIIGHVKANKFQATKAILEYYHIKGCDAVAFGDEMADVGMFSLCQYSVAMGNAPSSVKIHAKYTTAANNENGVAAFLEKCLHEQFS